MNQTRFCWLMPDHTFSNSWSQAAHDRLFSEEMFKTAIKQGWRIIKYVIVVGEDFEFPNQSHLAHTVSGNIKLKQ